VVIYFDDRCFACNTSPKDLEETKSKIEITLTRLSIQTYFGKTQPLEEVFNISLNLANGLQKLHKTSMLSDNPHAERIEDNYSKTISKESRFLSMGIKNLVRRENGIMKFCINWIES
jgi:hypothetical protein